MHLLRDWDTARTQLRNERGAKQNLNLLLMKQTLQVHVEPLIDGCCARAASGCAVQYSRVAAARAPGIRQKSPSLVDGAVRAEPLVDAQPRVRRAVQPRRRTTRWRCCARRTARAAPGEPCRTAASPQRRRSTRRRWCARRTAPRRRRVGAPLVDGAVRAEPLVDAQPRVHRAVRPRRRRVGAPLVDGAVRAV
jgi:hypothetical protein